MQEINGAEFNGIETHSLGYKYSQAVSLLSQQLTSKLEGCVMVETGLVGKNVVAANQLGTFSTKKREQRFEQTNVVDIKRDRAWFAPKMYSGAVLFDDLDKIKTAVDPQDKVVVAINGAYKKDTDEEIGKAFFADRLVGENAEKTQKFDENMVVKHTDYDGDILKQLIAMRTRFGDHDVNIDAEEIFCAVNSTMERKLMAAGVYVSADYMNEKASAGKKLPSYGGINFVRVNNLFRQEEGIVRLPMWCKSGMALGKWKDIEIKFSERGDLSHAKQIYVEYALGATRLEEAKVGAIEVKMA